MIGVLPPEAYRDLVARALAEDIGAGDVTSSATVPAEQRARGVLLVKGEVVICGLGVAAEVFRQCDASAAFDAQRKDGERCVPGTVVATVEGSARALLTAERTALNFLQRLSGIASETRRYVDAAGGRIVVLDTRKTTPTWRVIEKYAVRCGGGTNHRFRLDDGVLIKDNHKRLAGSITNALQRARAANIGLPIEVEVETLDELDEALAAGAERVLVDNFTPEDLRAAVQRTRGRAVVEVSGGVTLERIPEIAASGADFVSVGALTHSVKAADISFEVEPA
jgi:nicotinate-nucleotide pyrophosphorylase (carboxylating)